MCSLLLFSQTPAGCWPSDALSRHVQVEKNNPKRAANRRILQRGTRRFCCWVSSPDLDHPEAVSSGSAMSKYTTPSPLSQPPFKYWRRIMALACFPRPGRKETENQAHSCKSTCMFLHGMIQEWKQSQQEFTQSDRFTSFLSLWWGHWFAKQLLRSAGRTRRYMLFIPSVVTSSHIAGRPSLTNLNPC